MNTTAKERSEHLKQVIEKMSGRLLIVLTQPDPDAFSVFGLEAIVKKLNPELSVEIGYAGKFGHPQNRTIVKRLKLDAKMKKLEDLDLTKFDHFALVDSSSLSDNRAPVLTSIFANKIPTIVIDHHEGDNIEETDDVFIWRDFGVGAASTLVVELMRELGFVFNDENKDLAIILALGIRTDTKDLVNTTERDVSAYGFVATHLSSNDLMPYISYDLAPSFYEHRLRTLQEVRIEDTRLVTNVGFISSDDGDEIAILADEFIRRRGIDLVLVWGIVDRKEVRISARASAPDFPLNEFLKKHFGGGSKPTVSGRDEGGATVSFTSGEFSWISEQTKDLALELASKRIQEEVFGS